MIKIFAVAVAVALLFGSKANAQVVSSGSSISPIVIGQSHIPFVLVSSGTMGNNGAMTGVTAVAATYPNAYVYLPANAISSGSTAGWYYAVFSSGTAATIYNNTYTSGTPAIPASPTAFATTGPGAFTQTTGTVTAYSLSVPANSIGLNGSVMTNFSISYNNSAGSKAVSFAFGGTTYSGTTGTTTRNVGGFSGFYNRGVTGAQFSLTTAGTIYSGGNGGNVPVPMAIDTTVAQNLIAQVSVAAATDTVTLEMLTAQIVPGVQ